LRRVFALLSLLVVTATAACGGGSGGGDADTANAQLPPDRRQAIAAPFAAELEQLDLLVTRAAVVDRDTGQPGPNATHLAVYVEPTGTYTPDDFAAGLSTVTRVFLPAVFDLWPGLTSFDVCQEPVPGVDDRRVPAPKTQIDISRAVARRIDWDATDLEALLALAANDDNDAFTVFADDEVAASAMFQEHAPGLTTATPNGSAGY
jgi:hypothetical protein